MPFVLLGSIQSFRRQVDVHRAHTSNQNATSEIVFRIPFHVPPQNPPRLTLTASRGGHWEMASSAFVSFRKRSLLFTNLFILD